MEHPISEGEAPWLYVSDAGDVRLSNIRYRAPMVDGETLPAEAVHRDADIAMERDVAEMR